MLRRRAALPAVLAAIAAMCLTALPTGSASAEGAPKVPKAMLDALQRDLDLTAGEARARLAAEAKATQLESGLRKDLGSRFAGSWLSGNSATLTIATTDRSALSEITDRGAKAKLVTYSLAELDSAKAALDRSARSAEPSGTPLWYVDVKTNKVAVQSAKPAATRAFLARSGAERDAVRIIRATESPRAMYDLRGGEAYYINGSSRCSIGFPITKGATQGFVTAGHCGNQGASTTGFNQVAQGTFQGSSFPGNDYAWVATNSNWTATPWVKGSGGANVTVAGSTQAPVGASICRSGSTTGWHCGTIQQHNTSVTYPQGTINGVTRTSVCAEPGDSGGSYISGDQAQGVTSGGSGNCSSGGTTYHQPVNEILTTYGLTLKTGTGGPGPGTCESPEDTYQGSLSSNQRVVQPNGSYYQSTTSGAHVGCLRGPSGADFDLYLQKWNGSSWSTVAEGITPAQDEDINYSGTAGYYRYIVHAYSGSGSYTLGVSRP